MLLDKEAMNSPGASSAAHKGNFLAEAEHNLRGIKPRKGINLFMRNSTKTYLAGIIAFSVTGLIVLAAYHYKKRGSDAINFTAGKDSGSELSMVHYTGTRAGRLAWELNADSVKIAKEQDVAALTAVKAVFYAASGGVYRLNAKDGRLKESEGVIDAGGGVVVKSGKGDMFTADRLKFTIKSREITSKDRVEVASAGMKMTGTGLIVDVENERFAILRDVRAVFYNASK